MNLLRADGLQSGRAGENEALPSAVSCDVPCTGADAGSEKKIVRSQVGNGAVNGDSVSTSSQAAITFPNMELSLRRRQDGRQRVWRDTARLWGAI
jgi:hypothetical protein